MSEDHSIKILVAHTMTDPWNAILGRRPENYQIPEVGFTLMNMIDLAVFERDIEKAIVTGIIFEKWADRMSHFDCKAPAVMSTIYCIGGQMDIAELKVITAKNKVYDCLDCEAHYLKRYAYYLVSDERPRESIQAYSQAVRLFEELGVPLEQAKCLMNRGLVKSFMHDYGSALADEETAMDLLSPDSGHYLVIGSINRANVLMKMGRQDEARNAVTESQSLLAGMKNVERPKLILRWTTALLLDLTGQEKDRKRAAQMLDRVEYRMRHLSMHREIRVLLADRALVARATRTIKQIARRALGNQISPRVRERIQDVLDDPTREKILKWRNALDSYVPPFVESA